MRSSTEHNPDVAEIVDSTPTALNQKGMTYGEYLEQYPPKSPAQRPFEVHRENMTRKAITQPWSHIV